MAPLNSAVRQVRRALLVRDAAGLSDGQLLEWFLEQGEEAAFEALVRRHGPMVLGVCRRVLRHRHDAEDAFQATFLVLTRKAASIAKREMLAAWLYGVAYRIAVRAKAMSARRQTVTSDLSEVADPAGPEPAWDDLEPLLDQEISGLPARYRVPLVLCELEGRSRKEVARQLGIPEGTLSSRLARARDMLRLRLSRRGVSVGSAALAALLAGNASSATVPAQLLSATLKAAGLFVAGNGAAAGLSGKVAALAQAGLKGMLLERLRLAVILLIGVVLLGAGAAAGRRAFRMPADGRGGLRRRPGGQPHCSRAASGRRRRRRGGTRPARHGRQRRRR